LFDSSDNFGQKGNQSTDCEANNKAAFPIAGGDVMGGGDQGSENGEFPFQDPQLMDPSSE